MIHNRLPDIEILQEKNHHCGIGKPFDPPVIFGLFCIRLGNRDVSQVCAIKGFCSDLLHVIGNHQLGNIRSVKSLLTDLSDGTGSDHIGNLDLAVLTAVFTNPNGSVMHFILENALCLSLRADRFAFEAFRASGCRGFLLRESCLLQLIACKRSARIVLAFVSLQQRQRGCAVLLPGNADHFLQFR